MANRPVHDVFGATTGVVAAACSARELSGDKKGPELIGGGFGGWLGSRLPDVIDPPTSPNHRGIAHGVVPVGGAHAVIVPAVVNAQAWLREKADALRQGRAGLDNAALAFLNSLAEFLLRFLSGALVGFVAGYDSHLALDFMTPRGLPIVC